ncbi:MAG: HAMP domain-containing histidine kinase [Lachnospiraceae bacterium]|nr:HAMP domain-containing histidine kinase [Lachnospiraceae bacterium]
MFRNREIRQFSILFVIITAIVVIAGVAMHTMAGMLSFISAIVYGVAFFLFTRARYKGIAQISEQIDLVLHNSERLDINESEEGELSILRSEIVKMTLRIREQNEALKKEKEHLADSLVDIAHQLRTPLTSANLILSLLEKNQGEEEQKELLRETEKLFAQMDWLLTSLLKLSRLDAGVVAFRNEQVEVAALIKSVLHPLFISMDLHDIDLRVEIPRGVVIQGDPQWLCEALQNILKNCIESAGDHGKIEIDCEDTPLFTEIRFHDSGVGFREEELPRLFQRFYRGKNTSTAGYGIGLALCKTIIVRQGGTVTAKNHLQGGALFSVRFPK